MSVASSASVGLRSTGVDVTRTVAHALTAILSPGDVVLLVGDLGAGKTAFTQSVAEALGVSEPVTSPTFAIMNTYDCTAGGIDTLAHLDAYRLGAEAIEALEQIGLYDLVDDTARSVVIIIEWGDMVAAAFPGALRIEFLADDENVRELSFSRVGAPVGDLVVSTLTTLKQQLARATDPC
jgi:tRNA threonylcarbamoyladenosine biosynthesis protein TsaE